MMWTVMVRGLPAPKGSMKCIGKRGNVNHQLVEDKRVGQKEWREVLEYAGRSIGLERPLAGPVSIDVTFTLPLPKSVRPADREWPIVADSRDLDKLCRLLLDAWTGPVFVNDSQVVKLTACKAYPHTRVPDLTPGCGALIRVWRTRQ
jgi:Holliday junction resolvase RusA-like endonuclease